MFLSTYVYNFGVFDNILYRAQGFRFSKKDILKEHNSYPHLQSVILILYPMNSIGLFYIRCIRICFV